MSDRTSLSIAVWRGRDTEPEDLAHAVQTLRDRLGSQLDWPVDVTAEGAVPFPGAPYDSYGEYLDAFREEADLQAGTVNVCLYHRSFLGEAVDSLFEDALAVIDENTVLSCAPRGEATSGTEAFPYAGYDRGQLAPDATPHAVVNTEMRIPLLSQPIFENFVIHEVLHAVLDDAEAPVEGNDHSYGTVENGVASPMLTGYSEPLAQNPPPRTACGLEGGVPTALDHTTTLSQCTRDAVHDYLRDHLGGE